MKCMICKRQLSNTESIIRQIGPECAANFAAKLAGLGYTVESLDAMAALGNGEINRWLRFVPQAIGAGRMREAADFLDAARSIADSINPPVPVEEPLPAVAESHEIVIRKEGDLYTFTPAFKDPSFIEDFKKRIGRPFRTWNASAHRWEVKPLDFGMVELVAMILRNHFHGYTVRVA